MRRQVTGSLADRGATQARDPIRSRPGRPAASPPPVRSGPYLEPSMRTCVRMGQAEQRQVRSGVAGRVRRETETANIQKARLAAIRERRRTLDEHDRQRAGRLRALRADVALAILNPDPPSDEAVAAAAGWTLSDIAQLRDDLMRDRSTEEH